MKKGICMTFTSQWAHACIDTIRGSCMEPDKINEHALLINRKFTGAELLYKRGVEK